MFTRRDGKTVFEDVDTLATPAIPGLMIEDCVIRDRHKDPSIHLLAPGIYIDQVGDQIRAYDVDDTDIFKHTCEKILHSFVVDDDRLFALDDEGSAYVFHEDVSLPEVYELGRRPQGWHVVPKTNTAVVWNLLSIHVQHFKKGTRKVLRNHSSRVTAVCGDTSVTVTADSAGRVCIWYVASWTCFHELRIGEPVHQAEMMESHVVIRSTNKITVISVTSGQKEYTIPIRSNSLCITDAGIVVSHGSYIELFHNGVSSVKLRHKTSSLFRSKKDCFWSLQDLDLKEIRLTNECLEWVDDCLAWIAKPVFPFRKEWPSNHYMDVLAMSCDEWLPKISSYSVSMPYAWLEYEPLKKAIWEATLENDVRLSHNWLFLEKDNLKDWYKMCEKYVLDRVKDSYEWDPNIVAVLDAIHLHSPIVHLDIKKWCWFHHGRVTVRPIMMEIFENDQKCAFLSTIANETSSPDAITCVPILGVGAWLRRGYATVLIRWLKAFHKAYVVPPTHHMLDIYSMIVQHCFDEIQRSNMDVPLSGTGAWKSYPKLTPIHVGRYARHDGQHGFIRAVDIHPDGERTVKWTPVHRVTAVELQGPYELWEFGTKEGPRTYLECALTLMRESEWTSNMREKSWPWFRSEHGAFLNRGLEISLYGEHMHILSAEWTNTGGIIQTTSDMTIDEIDRVDIRCTPLRWSYIRQNLFHIEPLRLKINSILSLMCPKKHLATNYAEELLSCCQSKTFREISCCKPPQSRVTSIVSSNKFFVVGFEDGSIREYSRPAWFESPVRTFTKQDEPIQSLHLMDTRLIAICNSCFSVFSIPSGLFAFTHTTNFQYKGGLTIGGGRMWMIEYAGSRPFVTLWDIPEEIPLFVIDTKSLQTEISFQDIVTCKGACAIASQSKVVTWKEDDFHTIYDLDIQGYITCMTAIDDFVCGGTDEGVLFRLNVEDGDIQQWVSEDGYTISIIEQAPEREHAIVGTASGHILVWDIQHNEMVYVLPLCKRPIAAICIDNMFVTVAYNRKLVCFVFVSGQCLITCHTLQNIMNWSHSWRSRVLRDAKNTLIPCTIECFQDSKHVDASVITFIEECTREYNDRSDWCQKEVVEALMKSESPMAMTVIQRLVQFRGPRFQCPICNDEESQDSISFLKTCQHRFHTGCIHELIRKVPEYNDQMQYEYALSVELKCPSCRVPFEEEDVKLDVFLNQ